MKKLLLIRILLLLLVLIQPVAYCCNKFDCTSTSINYCLLDTEPRWSALLYYGKMTENNLGQVMRLDFSLANDTLYSFELGYQFRRDNPLRRFFQPMISTFEFMANVTLLDDAVYGTIYEVNPYLAGRWNNFPWNRVIKTSIAVGEGVSYVSRVPYTEQLNSDQPRRLLNFLLFEITFASPCYPNLELVARIHHRSGVFGFYHANNSGSTAVGLGVRYRF